MPKLKTYSGAKRLVGHLEVLALGAPIALRQLQHAVSSFARHHRAFDSSHLCQPPISVVILFIGNQ